MKWCLRLLALAIGLATPLQATHADTQTNDARQMLIGFWYGHDYQPGLKELVQRITHQRADGTFAVDFRKYVNCKLEWRQIESGKWIVEGDIETKFTTGIDMEPADYTDSYEIIELTETGKKMRHQQNGTIFTSQRVSEDFDFPDCEGFV